MKTFWANPSMRDALRRGTTLAAGKARAIEATAPTRAVSAHRGYTSTMRGVARRVDPKISQALDVYLLRAGHAAKHVGFGMRVKDTLKLMKEAADDEMDRQNKSGRWQNFALQVVDFVGDTVVTYDFAPETR